MRLPQSSTLPSVLPDGPALPRLEAARLALAEARSLDEVKQVRDQAESIRAYIRAAGYGLEMQNDVAEIKLRAERKAGELLREMDRQPRGRPLEKTSHDVTFSPPPRLEDLGIERIQASRWQQIAQVPETVFDAHISTVKADRQELTTAGVLEVAKELRRDELAERRAAVHEQRMAEPQADVFGRIDVADATALPLSDGVVDLIVTSPPYGLEVPYLGILDDANGWREFMTDWLIEAYRVTKDGGRLALNVPLDTTKPVPRATYVQAVAAALEAGWEYRWTIVWNEGNVSKSVARGSVDSPSAPHVITPVEMIPVFCKGEWPRSSGRVSDLKHDEWLEWTNGLWTFPGESRPWMGHPAPFPPELPRRLIKLLSYREDTVLDPFNGSGTTTLVGWQLGREVIGFDQSADYAHQAQQRLAEAIHAAS